MVESVVGKSAESLSLNFTRVEVVAHPHGCAPGMDTCLIEEDGTYPQAP
jgi:hypothetical protein